jgi:hypothetical protein
VSELDASEDSELPEEMCAPLLRTRIDTYEKLEILRLLHDDPQRRWNPKQLSDRLHLSEPVVDAAVSVLQFDGLLRRSAEVSGERASYSLANSAVSGASERVVREYRERPLRIMQIITVYAIERVRSGALRASVDAFQKKDFDWPTMRKAMCWWFPERVET